MSKKKSFSILEAVSFGFSSFKKHFNIFLFVILTGAALNIFWFFAKKILLPINIVFEDGIFVDSVLKKAVQIKEIFYKIPLPQVVGIVLSLLIYLFFYCLFQIGRVKIALNIYDKKKVSYKTLFSSYHLIWNYLIATSLYLLMVVTGLVFLVIPGLFLLIVYGFYNCFIVDEKSAPIESLKKSNKIVAGADLFYYFLTMLLFGFVSNIVRHIGLDVFSWAEVTSSMIFICVTVFVYKKLKEQI